jgi:hypothetical protein
VGCAPPKFVRPLEDAEREALAAGLRSSDAFVLRRCQILLASTLRTGDQSTVPPQREAVPVTRWTPAVLAMTES